MTETMQPSPFSFPAREAPKPGQDRIVRLCALGCLAGLGGFLIWAAAVPLAEGVAASGHVVVEDSRQVVQHLEGGLIRDLMVREGDRVEAGEPLLVLQDVAALATRDQVLQQIATFRGSVARLHALEAGLEAREFADPEFSALAALDLDPEILEDVRTRQGDLFEQQRDAFAADLEVLEARRTGAIDAARSFRQQVVHARRELATVVEDLGRRRDLVARQLARRDEVTALERDEARLEAEITRLNASVNEQEILARDLTGQIAQAEARFAEQISTELLEVRTQLQAAEEQLGAAQDVIDRAVVLAPASGSVLNMRFSTRGGVVRPGEPIMEIIPAAGAVTALVRVRPTDRALVYEGQSVRTRVLAYRSWRAPRFEGEVVSVSADLKTDNTTGATYYEARLRLADETDGQLSIDPGMPVEAFIFSGSQRTTLDYLLEPLGEAIYRGVRGA